MIKFDYYFRSKEHNDTPIILGINFNYIGRPERYEKLYNYYTKRNLIGLRDSLNDRTLYITLYMLGTALEISLTLIGGK